MEPASLNVPAVALGAAAAFALGMLWFSPAMFGRAWSSGSHGITPPQSPPWAAMALQLAGTTLYAVVIGLTETVGALGLAILVILTLAVLQSSMALFSQKRPAAALIDGGYILAMGVVMILAQAVL